MIEIIEMVLTAASVVIACVAVLLVLDAKKALGGSECDWEDEN